MHVCVVWFVHQYISSYVNHILNIFSECFLDIDTEVIHSHAVTRELDVFWGCKMTYSKPTSFLT